MACQSILASHPPFPIFMYLLAMTVVSANGAQMFQFAKFVPIVLWVLNVNYSQTRKSQLTGLAEGRCAKVVCPHFRSGVNPRTSPSG